MRPSPAKLRYTCTKNLRLNAAPNLSASVFRGSRLIRSHQHQPSHAQGPRTWGNNGRAVGYLHIVLWSVPADIGRADEFCIKSYSSSLN